MSANEDFGLLWKQQKVAAIPDIKDVLKQGARVKNKIRNKVLRNLVVSVVGIAYYIFFMIYFHPKMLTTVIGVLLMLLAIIIYQAVAVTVLPLLAKNNFELSSKEYLDKLILLKQKQNFVNKKVLNVFFLLISAGLMVFMVEFALMMQLVWAVAAYLFVAGWLVFVWVYIRPRKIKKQTSEINEAINKLEKLDKQITLNE